MKSKHPYEPFIPNDTKRLIIGTIPPPRFCKEGYELNADDVRFYYGSKDNAFWKLINELFNANLSFENADMAIDDRKNLLVRLNLGITDIIEECIHVNDSAADEDLDEIVNKDLAKLLINNPAIDTLIYTSEFVKKEINKMFMTYHSINPENKKLQSVGINGKKYSVHILYSPSPNALRNMGKYGTEKRMQQYREVLLHD